MPTLCFTEETTPSTTTPVSTPTTTPAEIISTSRKPNLHFLYLFLHAVEVLRTVWTVFNRYVCSVSDSAVIYAVEVYAYSV